MSNALAQELDRALQREFAFRREGEWYRKGKCPECHKKELYVHAEKPFVLKCGRLNRCGYEKSVKSYFPEIFDDWSKRFKATEADPNAAADAFLQHGRKLDLTGMRGCYSQEYYKDPERNIGTATVRFPLPGGTWWERLIDQPGRFEMKARFQPKRAAGGKSYKGYCWAPPALTIEKQAAAERILIAEGIFNAWALTMAGHAAVSAMTVNNWPEHWLQELRLAIANGPTPNHRPELVFAFDVGAAGVKWSRDFVKRAEEEGWSATACQASLVEGDAKDWNDLLELGRLTPSDFDEYFWNGRVTIASSALEKACLIHERKHWNGFSFSFDNRMWWASFNQARIAEVRLKEGLTEKAAIRACAEVDEIANCAFRTLYRERDDVIDDTAYYLRVDFPGKTPTAKGRFSAAQLTAAPEFKKRLFAFGGMFTGSTGQLDRLMQIQTRDLKTVEPIDFTGYSKAHGAWILGDIAVRGGRVHDLNAEDYFDFGKVAVKLRSPERLLDISYDRDTFNIDWLPKLWAAYGAKGLIALTFWQISLFAEQIREAHKSLAFLQIIGEPGSGKSTLLEFLWRLYGRDSYEGFDPTKATSAAIARNLGKVGNLPVVLIEGDRDESTPHSKRFEWDELKTAYNGRAVRSRGVRSGGMETYDPPFRGAVVIAQNFAVKASAALLERLMSLTINKEGWSPDTKVAAEAIESWPTDTLSGFIIHIIRQEEAWLAAFFAAYKKHEKALPEASGVSHQRLVKNHAQLAAGLDALATVISIPDDVRERGHEFIRGMIRERHQAISADHPHVAKFWELFDWFEANEVVQTNPINLHSKADKLIAVSLPMFEERCRQRGIQAPPMDDLKQLLRSSKSRRFLAAKNVKTRLENKVIHCWVFAQPEGRDDVMED